MKIKQLRIDSRLIHGQVATFWTNFLGVNRIVVVSDEIVKDKLQVDMLRMSCPSGCKLTVCQTSTLITNLENDKYRGDDLLIISPNIETVCKLYEGLHNKQLFPPINVGNIPKREATYPLARTVNITTRERVMLEELASSGLEVFLQMIPSVPAISLKEALAISGKDKHDA